VLSDQEADDVVLPRLPGKESPTLKLFSAISHDASKYKNQDLTLIAPPLMSALANPAVALINAYCKDV